MRTRYLIVILIAGIIVTVMSAIYFFKTPGRGDVAPAFMLTDMKGEKVSLEAQRGKVVFLHFWATWCGTCLSEIGQIERIYREFKDRNVSVITVLVDDKGAGLDALKERVELTYPVFPDPDGLVADSYQVWGVPESFIIDKNGVITNRSVSAVNFEDVKKIIETSLAR